MGEYADIERSNELMRDWDTVPRWRMKDGTSIDIADMHTNHLKRVIAMIDKLALAADISLSLRYTLEVLNDELKLRSDT